MICGGNYRVFGSVTDLMSLTTYLVLVFIVLANLVRRPLQISLRLCYFTSACSEIWQECSSSKYCYASIDRVRFSI